jgi:hypothetical protein
MIRIFRFAGATLGKGFAVRLWDYYCRLGLSAFGGKADIVATHRSG